MARLIKVDGTEEHPVPQGGKKWRLGELQSLVGGYIELMPGIAPMRMLVNENGRPKALPVNAAATLVLHQRMAEKLGCRVEDLPREVGRRLRYLPELRGDVLILEPGEKM